MNKNKYRRKLLNRSNDEAAKIEKLKKKNPNQKLKGGRISN